MKSDRPNNPEGVARISRAFGRYMLQWTHITQFIEWTQSGWDVFSAKVGQQASEIIDSAFSDVEEKLRSNPHAAAALKLAMDLEVPRKAATFTAKTQLREIEAVAKSAVLVFDHSLLDNLFLEFLRGTEVLSPEMWDEAIADRKVAFSSLRAETVIDVRSAMIDKYFDELDRASLVRKADQLYRICNPPAGFSGVRGYIYEKSKLKEFDSQRHEVVHGEGLSSVRFDIATPHEYAFATATHFFSLLKQEYGDIEVPIDSFRVDS